MTLMLPSPKRHRWRPDRVGVWAAPGAPETLGLRGPRGGPDPNTMTDIQPLLFVEFFTKPMCNRMAFLYSLLESGPQPAQNHRASTENGRPTATTANPH